MKIGILTYHRSHNFGAVLQAYGLLSHLTQEGHEVSIIDYWPNYRKDQYQIFDRNSGTSFLSRSKSAINNIILLPFRYIRFKKFERFINQDLNLNTSIIINKGEDISDSYDIIIHGSDQIWRYNKGAYCGFDEVYFGKFPVVRSVKKIAYAASMGNEEMLKDKAVSNDMLRCLEHLNEIAVRETSLMQFINANTAREVTSVMDPVFLLPSEVWKSKVGKTSSLKYLLLYQLQMNTEAVKIARRLADQHNLEIIEIRGVATYKSYIGRTKSAIGPWDFISLIANSSYVVTSSFHGIAFSIIFNKPFVATGFKHGKARILSLLKTLNLESRYSELSSDVDDSEINYGIIESNIKKRVAASRDFLLNAISRDNGN